MKSEHRACQQCKKDFVIETKDFSFYEMMKVPAPTFCPLCRQQRRMTHYINVSQPKMHARLCDATGKKLISIYPPQSIFPVYDRDYWFSDAWDPMNYGVSYDFSKPFFVQFNELQRKVPRYHTRSVNSVNCEYCPSATNSKDCYLSRVWGSQSCLYATTCYQNRDCVDAHFLLNSELSYSCIDSMQCYKVFFGQYIDHCSESAFLFNCKDCSHCFGCVNLKHKSYHIFNEPYSKESYAEELRKYSLASWKGLEKIEQLFTDFVLRQPHCFAKIVNCTDVTGDNLRYANQCHDSFGILQADKNRFIVDSGANLTDCYDGHDIGINSSLLYEVAGVGTNMSHSMFNSWVSGPGFDVQYSDVCNNCSSIFGCVGLRGKKFCILNKQYTEEEYIALVPKIIEHMKSMPYTDSRGSAYAYGEFFPAELSMYAYNDTLANQYFSTTRENAVSAGWTWRDEKEREISTTMHAKDIPDRIEDVPESITREVIADLNGHPFKIIPQELAFYRKMNLALPRYCPECRHKQRLAQRNPFQLWTRSCDCAGTTSRRGGYANQFAHAHGTNACSNSFQTAFAPERKEIIYCQECYTAEIA